MSIFAETMAKAIGDYRQLLRRYLTQADRMYKLQQLGLRESDIYDNDVTVYGIGHAIVTDIQKNMAVPTQGYYTYSGIKQFCTYLSEYLADYFIEGDRVVHRAQKASRALLSTVQLTGLPQTSLNESLKQQLLDCNKTVVEFGSPEQCELQQQILSRQHVKNPGFYTHILAHLETLMHSRAMAA